MKKQHNATEIIPGIWVGDQSASKDANFFKNFNISVVINCTKDLPHSFLNHNLLYIRIPIDDSLQKKDINIMTEYLPSIVDIIKEQHKDFGKKILIHCHAGMQRSAAVCVAYLHKHYRLPLSKAVKHMVNRRPIAFHFGQHINFYDSLKEFEKQIDNY